MKKGFLKKTQPCQKGCDEGAEVEEICYSTAIPAILETSGTRHNMRYREWGPEACTKIDKLTLIAVV